MNKAIYCAVLVCGALALPACESLVEIDATVEVSPEISGRFSPAQPGVLHIGGEVPKTGWVGGVVGVVCGPSATPLSFTFHHDGFGCAMRATLTAWIEPAPIPPGAQCGPTEIEDIGGPSSDPAKGIAVDAVTIFESTDMHSCPSDHATAALSLAAP